MDHFRRSSFRAEVLLLFGEAAEEATAKLSADAGRRLKGATSAPEFTYFLNYTGLDRYNRHGIRFVFDASARRFHYDGAAWREILRYYPRSPEARSAMDRLAQLPK